MTRTRFYNTEAVVLKKNELGEADSILTLYTPNRGKVRAVARGVRRPKSKLGGHVELLTYSQMSLSQSKSLDIITQSQTIDSFLPLRDDLWRTSQALYVVEIIGQSTAEEESNYPLFKLLVDTLHWLCQAHDSETTLRCFELHLSQCLGYRPQLYECLCCRNSLKTDDSFYFTPTGGGVICHHCRNRESMVFPLSRNALKTMRYLQRSDYASADRLRVKPELSSELKRLMQGYIRYLLERRVKSGEWLDRLKREGLSLD
ncbi:DNA repair protein RecO [Chloroflexota bacterium]